MIAVLCISSAKATITDLSIDVSAQSKEILPGIDQVLFTDTNEKGIGILIVIQPTGCVTPTNDNFLPVLLDANIKSQIMSLINGKVISYFVDYGWNAQNDRQHIFPDQFKGLNGVPSTNIPGTYKVIFAFVSLQYEIVRCRIKCDLDFACDSACFNVIPEVPMGTIMALVPSLAAFATVKVYKRRRTSQ